LNNEHPRRASNFGHNAMEAWCEVDAPLHGSTLGLRWGGCKETGRMLDTILEHPVFLNRHRQAPLLKERASFLSHLQQQGTSRKALRNLSGELLQIVRLLKLTDMRDVSLE